MSENELIGRNFRLQDGEYTVVDLRKMHGETMVYAELVGEHQEPRQGRAAFRLSDIEAHWLDSAVA